MLDGIGNVAQLREVSSIGCRLEQTTGGVLGNREGCIISNERTAVVPTVELVTRSCGCGHGSRSTRNCIDVFRCRTLCRNGQCTARCRATFLSRIGDACRIGCPQKAQNDGVRVVIGCCDGRNRCASRNIDPVGAALILPLRILVTIPGWDLARPGGLRNRVGPACLARSRRGKAARSRIALAVNTQIIFEVEDLLDPVDVEYDVRARSNLNNRCGELRIEHRLIAERITLQGGCCVRIVEGLDVVLAIEAMDVDGVARLDVTIFGANLGHGSGDRVASSINIHFVVIDGPGRIVLIHCIQVEGRACCHRCIASDGCQSDRIRSTRPGGLGTALRGVIPADQALRTIRGYWIIVGNGVCPFQILALGELVGTIAEDHGEGLLFPNTIERERHNRVGRGAVHILVCSAEYRGIGNGHALTICLGVPAEEVITIGGQRFIASRTQVRGIPVNRGLVANGDAARRKLCVVSNGVVFFDPFRIELERRDIVFGDAGLLSHNSLTEGGGGTSHIDARAREVCCGEPTSEGVTQLLHVLRIGEHDVVNHVGPLQLCTARNRGLGDRGKVAAIGVVVDGVTIARFPLCVEDHIGTHNLIGRKIGVRSTRAISLGVPSNEAIARLALNSRNIGSAKCSVIRDRVRGLLGHVRGAICPTTHGGVADVELNRVLLNLEECVVGNRTSSIDAINLERFDHIAVGARKPRRINGLGASSILEPTTEHVASCCRCRCTCCGARCHVNALRARGNRAHGAAARGEGVIDGCLVLLEDRVERYAIVAIGNNLGKVFVDRIILRASRHGERTACCIGVERARARNIPRGNRGPTQEGVGTLVVDIVVGHRQGHTIANLLLQIGRTRARYARDVGALIAEVNLLPGLLPQCGELIRGVAEGRHVVAGVLHEYIIHIMAGVLARNASTIDPTPADELPTRVRNGVARIATCAGVLE